MPCTRMGISNLRRSMKNVSSLGGPGIHVSGPPHSSCLQRDNKDTGNCEVKTGVHSSPPGRRPQSPRRTAAPARRWMAAARPSQQEAMPLIGIPCTARQNRRNQSACIGPFVRPHVPLQRARQTCNKPVHPKSTYRFKSHLNLHSVIRAWY